MNSCWLNIDVIKSNFRTHYRQKVKNEVPDNGACELAFVIIDVLLDFTTEMFGEYNRVLRKTIGKQKISNGFIN